ncbi:MAG: beta-galactosidase, partial [Candidatus Paceibacterota bacterium]
MNKINKKYKVLIILGVIVLAFFLLSIRKVPKDLTYGVSFSKFHSDELKLDWREVYLSLLNDLGVKNFRFSAHWPNTEPKDGKFNFSELDFQMDQARSHDASVILAVGRRLPGWPECHVPEWAQELSYEEQKQKILRLIETVVNRYKDYDNIKYWQVE